MDDADGVARGQAVEDGVGDSQDLGEGHDPSGAFPGFTDGLAFEQLHDEKRLVVLGHVVVENADAGRVADFVRDVGFPQKAVADDPIAREIRVQDLERRSLAIPVRRCVDRSHPADAQESVQVPLASDRRPDARRRAVVGLPRRRAGLRGVQRFGHALVFPPRSFLGRGPGRTTDKTDPVS